MPHPQTIQVYLPQGEPTGIRIATVTTRTVTVVDVPRPLLARFFKMGEASQVGMYFLISDDPEDRVAYIGQSGDVGRRLSQHQGSRDFWTRALVAVSLTRDWTSTHVAYLEWLAIARAQEAGRYRLENGNQASNPFTPAPLEADCREYFETIAMLAGVLGVPLLERQVSIADSDADDHPGQPGDATGELFLNDRACTGIGNQLSDGFTVRTGSIGRMQLQASAPGRLADLRSRLLSAGDIEAHDDKFTVLRDLAFPSPSAAAQFLTGTSVNGRKLWRDRQGRSINELEQIAVESAEHDVL
ncbi:GIY-YIG nuclease family protein [Curtobacterium luteum]|uniref:DUF4357 domain-containing protein n=1 Tax=Curtobacterium luteum TaxID=33881 RepID=A0A175RMK9_9MICO|nr:GIY-YIG nuclease family protein [Curtobacterium luteum]KTR04588.1 hypothetical protein NS184_11585 [Curtobacterium luteum]